MDKWFIGLLIFPGIPFIVSAVCRAIVEIHCHALIMKNAREEAERFKIVPKEGAIWN